MVKLVEGFVARLKVPPGKRDIIVFDDALPGFGLRKFSSGRASYVVKYSIGPQQRRHSLEPVVAGNLKAMRLEASRMLAKARLGQDVAAETRAAGRKRTITLGESAKKYLEARRSALRARSYIEAERYLLRSWKPLHGQSIETITRADIVGVIDKLERANGPVACDRARTALSALFAWAIDRGHLDANPVFNIKARAQETRRSRVLTEAELAEVWQACRDDDYGKIVKLLILSGQRRDEIGGLMHSEINYAERQIDLPEHRTKNNKPHIVPLSDSAVAILTSTLANNERDAVFGRGAAGFSGWSKSKRELDLRIARARKSAGVRKPMLPWVLHDLRRSFVTHLNERKVAPPHVIEAVVNHISGHLAGVAGVYNKAQYLDERRSAMSAWAAHVETLTRVGGAA